MPITRTEIREAIQSLFTVFDEEVDAPTRERDLRLALDRLALAYHFVEVEFDPNTPSPDGVPPGAERSELALDAAEHAVAGTLEIRSTC